MYVGSLLVKKITCMCVLNPTKRSRLIRSVNRDQVVCFVLRRKGNFLGA